jgi:hypothetical protein
MTGRIRHRLADDSGASLILALLLTTALGLVAAALLTYSGTAINATLATRDRAQVTYDVDGALQATINGVRNSTYNNGTGQTCAPAGFPGQNQTRAVAVTCAAGPGSGASGSSVPITSANKPGSALLTLGTHAGEPGIEQSSNNVLRIRGRVYSNSTVVANPGELQVADAQLIARGSCAGTIVSTPAPSCNNTSANPAGNDPGYPQPTSGMVYREAPATCAAGSVIHLDPGYYDDATALSNLTSGAGNCKRKTIHFRPGTYHLDFRNGENGVPAGSHVWDVADKDTVVIGGTVTPGWDTTTRPTPGSCVSPLESTSANGVTFVFGGDSRLNVAAGRVELCGTYSSGSPPVTVYGATSGADTSATATTTVATATASAGSGTFTGSPNLAAAVTATDGSFASATASNTSRTLTTTGFATTALPAGSILTAASVRIVHRASMTGSGSTVLATVKRGGTTLATNPLTLGGALGAEDIPVTNALADAVHDTGSVPVLQVTYAATATNKGTVTADVDSVRLVLTYTPPTVRSQRTSGSCVGTAPYVPATTNCALIRTAGSQASLYIQGTTYAPYAALDIALTNASGQVFRSGLIARSLRIKITASSGFAEPVIMVPDDASAATPLDVYFRAYLCPEGSACSSPAPAAPWKLAGTSRVRYTDPGGSPSAGHRDVDVLSWTLHR